MTGEAGATRRVAAGRTSERPAADRSAAPADRVEVSRDAQRMTGALKAASGPTETRQEVVERMRRLVESGELGSDSAKVADAVIDHMLGLR